MITPHLLTTLALALDTDGDRLTDAVEAQLGTDPTRFDSDGDTLSDGAEVVVLRSDPGRNDALACPSFERIHLATAAVVGPFTALQDVAAGDLDGDLDPDVVVVWSGEVRWLERREDGSFAEHPLTATGAVRVRLADVDGDGDLDVVYQYGDAPGWVATLRNLGDRRFVPGPLQSLREGDLGPTDLELGDLDGDGLPDLVAANGGSGAGWYPNLGDGVFGSRREVYGGAPGGVDTTHVELADLDADGDLDLVGASEYGDGFGWTTNQGRGRFGAFQPIAYRGDPAIPLALEVDDLDGDGLPDVALVGKDSVFRPGRLDLLRNTGRGFTFVGTLGEADTLLGTADPDGDGDHDLVTGGATARWLENRSGSFGPGRAITDTFLVGMAAADLDGDGADELVGIGAGIDLLVPAFGDPDRDGLDTALETCLTGTDPAIGDTDGGGALDGHDLLELSDPTDPSDDPPTGPDADNDGLGDDLERLVLGTDPALGDTDGDGLLDGVEARMHASDPRSGDGDGDGVTDDVEVALGLDPGRRDSDGDRLPDGEDHAVADAALPDADGDGTPDGEEVLRFGTDPAVTDADTDGDGLADAVELALGTGPTRDTDGDGLADGEEVWTLDLLPRRVDTDGDGVHDGAEVRVLGTDPVLDESTCAVVPVDTATTTWTRVVAADLDIDGDDDLVLSGRPNASAWREVLADGTLGPEHPIDPGYADVIPADLDGDGDLDAVLTDLVELSWAENVGGGLFAPAVVIDASGRADVRSILPIDVDGDGLLDLVTWTSAPRISLYRNLGGTFGPRRILANPRDTTRLVAWDYQADGDTDVLLVSGPDQWGPGRANTVSVLPNVGGGFGAIVPIGVGGLVSVLDLDADADDDLVLWLEQPGIVVSYANGSAGLGAPVPQNAPPVWELAPGADMDGDGDEDLVVGHTWIENEAGALGRGHRIFAPTRDVSNPAVGDLDGDGDPDSAFTGQGAVTVVTNTLTDLDRDGLSEAAEVCLTATDPALPDTDAGGTSDGQELLDLTDPAVAGDDLP